MSTVSQARTWKADSLREQSREWRAAGSTLSGHMDVASRAVDRSRDDFVGDAADAMRDAHATVHGDATQVKAALDAGATAADNAASDIEAHCKVAVGKADDAIHHIFEVADDGTVTVPQWVKSMIIASDKSADHTDWIVRIAALEEDATNRTAALKEALGDIDTSVTNGENAVKTAFANLPEAAASSANAGRVADIVAGKQQVPGDPKEFHDFWTGLTPAEKDQLYQHDSLIGGHDGMPAIDRDHYNRITLDAERTQAASAQATVDQLTHQHPDWAKGENIPKNEPGARFKDVDTYNAWKQQYDSATKGSKNLKDLDAVDKTLREHSDAMLLVLDTKTGGMAHAAVAIGNPDTAQHVAVTAPGLDTNVHGSLDSMVDEAANLKDTTTQSLRKFGHGGEPVSTIAWIGADLPQGDPVGYWEVAQDDLAKAGAGKLAGFYDGIAASHAGGDPHITAVGHSYGSLMTGLALQQPGNHPVDDLLVYGSPGLETGHNPWDDALDKLHLQPGHAFEMTAHDDPVASFNRFGLSPGYIPGFEHLSTDATTTPDGVSRDGATGHSEYPRAGSDGELRTTGYNESIVVGGLADTQFNGADVLVHGGGGWTKSIPDIARRLPGI